MESYDEIISLPHHISQKHQPMTMLNRAAQFSPFAALTGYDEAVEETARLTNSRRELTEEQTDILNKQIQQLTEGEKTHVSVTYFVPDKRKSGGSYETFEGDFRIIDIADGKMKFTDGTEIMINEIYRIEFPEIELEYSQGLHGN